MKTVKTIGITVFNVKKFTFISPREKSQKAVKLRIRKIYYVLLTFRYISFSSHEIVFFVFWNQEKPGF